ncbi:MAG: thioesterase [Verrucomicrobia bacterium]|nr:MAG: thioesterase [Verrucomicrobiota bacterium]
MKGKPKIGTSSELRFVVEPRHAIDFADGGMPAVLSTPHLVGFLERTAREALAPLLEDNERSVGVEIEIRHLAPTPVGQNVTCVARIVHADGTQITFQVEARDEQELIMRGLHKRQIVRVDRFAQRVSHKTAPR